MWIFSSSQMPNYSFLLILLLRSCQGCTHPLSPGIWIPLKKHLNSVTWGLCSHHRVTSQEPLQMTVSDKEHLMLEWCCLLPVEVRGSRKDLWGCQPALTRQEHALSYGVFKQSYCVTNNSIHFALGRTQDWIHSLLLTTQWGLPQIAESKWKGMVKRVKHEGCAAH